MGNKLFISHSADSTEFAEYLHKNFHLVHPNIETWYSSDPICLPDGQGSTDSIITATKECFACLSILTLENMNRWWMTFEAGCFIGMEKPIYALLCGDNFTHRSRQLQGYPITTLGTNFSSLSQKRDFNALIISINMAVTESKRVKEATIENSVDNNYQNILDEYKKYFDTKSSDLEKTIAGLPSKS